MDAREELFRVSPAIGTAYARILAEYDAVEAHCDPHCRRVVAVDNYLKEIAEVAHNQQSLPALELLVTAEPFLSRFTHEAKELQKENALRVEVREFTDRLEESARKLQLLDPRSDAFTHEMRIASGTVSAFSQKAPGGRSEKVSSIVADFLLRRRSQYAVKEAAMELLRSRAQVFQANDNRTSLEDRREQKRRRAAAFIEDFLEQVGISGWWARDNRADEDIKAWLRDEVGLVTEYAGSPCARQQLSNLMRNYLNGQVSLEMLQREAAMWVCAEAPASALQGAAEEIDSEAETDGITP